MVVFWSEMVSASETQQFIFIICKLQIVLCENNIYSQGHMNDTLTHELIHTLDYCRAELDWKNIDHLACTEIRAASLSGECFFWKENFARLKLGWKKHHQVSETMRLWGGRESVDTLIQ